MRQWRAGQAGGHSQAGVMSATGYRVSSLSPKSNTSVVLGDMVKRIV